MGYLADNRIMGHDGLAEITPDRHPDPDIILNVNRIVKVILLPDAFKDFLIRMLPRQINRGIAGSGAHEDEGDD